MKAHAAAAVVLSTALTLAISAAAVAHSGATGVVKQRMDRMGAIGDATEALTAVFSGEVAYDAAAVTRYAETIRDHAGEAITSLFPEASISGPSEAKPEIWANWDEFVGLADRLEVTADGLARAAGNAPAGDDAMPSMEDMMGGGHDTDSMMGTSDMGTMTGAAPDDMPVDAAILGEMPADRVFAMLGDTCTACHTKFRAGKR